MTKLFALAALAFTAVASPARAQAPATNPMPDGSRDMYVGLGLVSAARYEGAQDRERKALPVLQVQWSNGAFVSGMRAGIHLSQAPRIEFGPLLELQRRRDEGGDAGQVSAAEPARMSISASAPESEPAANPLAGMRPLHGRLQAGGFFNYSLAPDWRLTSSALYGAGNARHGAKLELGVQRLALALGTHHRVALGAGLTLANRSYNNAFFGVDEMDSASSANPMFDAAGGLKDAHLDARWNWAWSPSWMLASSLQATHLLGSARHSPLAERPNNLTVSTAIAYRF